VQDVLEQIVGVAVGDESLHPIEMPCAVRLLDGLRASGADVGAGVGLGEHHRGTPVPVDRHRRPALLLFVADVVEDVGKDGAGEVHERGRLSAERELVDRPRHHRGCGHATDVLGQADAEPLALLPGAERLLERFGQRDGVRARIERRRVAVRLGERLRERALCQAGRLVEHLSHRLRVEIAELAGRQNLLQIEHLVEVELEITHVALVVPHASRLSPSELPFRA
jgi:hypothetical protein